MLRLQELLVAGAGGDLFAQVGQLGGVVGFDFGVPLVIVIGAQGGGGLILPLDLAQGLDVQDLIADDVAGAVGGFDDGGVAGLAAFGEEPVGQVGVQAGAVGVLVQTAVVLVGLVGAVGLGQFTEGISGGVAVLPLVQQVVGLGLGGGQLLVGGQVGAVLVLAGVVSARTSMLR